MDPGSTILDCTPQIVHAGGATVTYSFPVIFDESMNLGSDRGRGPSVGGALPFGEASEVRRHPARVLIVEDDEAIRESLGEGLRDNGLKVTSVGDGRQALDLLRSEPLPSAIVLDLMMPEMDGWDFRQEQLSDPVLRDIPIVVITATGFSPRTVRMQLGEVEVIAKPVRQADLLDALDRACGRRH